MSDSTQALRDRLKNAAENPEDQPRVAPMALSVEPKFKLSTAELRRACDANPGHPKAKIFRKAVASFPPAKEVTVDRLDLEAVLDDLDIGVEHKIEPANPDVPLEVQGGDAVKVQRKKLVPRDPSKPPSSKSTGSVKSQGGQPLANKPKD